MKNRNGVQLATVPMLVLLVSLGAVSLKGRAPQLSSKDENGTFYFHGTINQILEVEMTLTRAGNQVDGIYMYARHLKAIILHGRKMAASVYEIDELSPDGTVSAQFKLSDLDAPGHSTGTWEGANGRQKLPVVLGEITPKQHELLHEMWESKPQIAVLTIGEDHSCVKRTLGASCWGEIPLMPSLATRGPGMVAHRALPDLLIDDTILAVTTGSRRLCVLQSAAMRCAQPYDPKLPLQELTPIPGFEHDVSMIGSNVRYACGVVGEALKCWDGSSLSADSVTEIIHSHVDRLSSGNPQCAVISAGGVKCWSIEYDQQEKRNKLVVQEVSGLNREIRSISAAGFDEQHFACAVDDEGLKCWGNNFARPMGSRAGGVRNLPPAPIPGLETGVTTVSTELNHSCAIKEGRVYCWGGFNFLGELGDKKPEALGDVVEVSGIENANQIAVGPGYSCALTRDNHVFCWGDNEFGQTGNVSHDVCKEPNGKADPIETPCNRHPVEVLGLD
ncbi:MAG TPA: RCC1 domain-containing protein [Candidatus Solibacter sp.]|nr:RCC1 domain-containing protein [Candidatus Solibacter sp.]